MTARPVRRPKRTRGSLNRYRAAISAIYDRTLDWSLWINPEFISSEIQEAIRLSSKMGDQEAERAFRKALLYHGLCDGENCASLGRIACRLAREFCEDRLLEWDAYDQYMKSCESEDGASPHARKKDTKKALQEYNALIVSISSRHEDVKKSFCAEWTRRNLEKAIREASWIGDERAEGEFRRALEFLERSEMERCHALVIEACSRATEFYFDRMREWEANRRRVRDARLASG